MKKDILKTEWIWCILFVFNFLLSTILYKFIILTTGEFEVNIYFPDFYKCIHPTLQLTVNQKDKKIVKQYLTFC